MSEKTTKTKPLSRTRDERIADQIRKHLATTFLLCEELVSRGYTLRPLINDLDGSDSEVVVNYSMTCEKEL